METNNLYSTTDINLAAFLLYEGVEPKKIELNGRSYGIMYYDRETSIPIVAKFHTADSPEVNLRRYNQCRAQITKRVKEVKRGND